MGDRKGGHLYGGDLYDASDAFEFAELLEKVRTLPPMTAEQRIEQKISFAWGNAAIEWPTPPPMTLEAVAAQVWKMEWLKLRKALESIRDGNMDADSAYEAVKEALR
jgi:hypothetical protein